MKRKTIVTVVFAIITLWAKGQFADPPQSLSYMVMPVEEVRAEQLGNMDSLGILGSYPQGINIKLLAEITVADTSELSKIYIILDTVPGGNNLLDTAIIFQDALQAGEDKFIINENIMLITLGTFRKPLTIYGEAKLENRDGFISTPVSKQLY